ncbi:MULTISPECIES: hypothetical protein [Pseudomonas]|uniref:Uncharacterized protein n=1 Tax=Pseudomonas weihenstephanensis TaxID=1608994 RepID=A0ABS1ZGY3_9PSED|nr:MULTISPECIES: hypothetical protein [Pseudomonas]MBM1195663.1 hypothetical protein [Pseudomonas weihenstephanensis]MCM2364284.1 hypothetical protein [Pseudomonas sp. SR18]
MSDNDPQNPNAPEPAKPASWYSSVITDQGVKVSGGAALLVRIAKQGGMDAVCQKAGEAGARFALQMANNAVTDTPVNDPKITPINVSKQSANSDDAT